MKEEQSKAIKSGYQLSGEAVSFYRYHPVSFIRDQILCTDRTGFGLTKEQELAIKLVFRLKDGMELDEQGRRRFGLTIPAGHGVGKTAFLAILILTWLYLFPTAKIPVTSTKKEQLGDNLWPEIFKYLQISNLKEDYIWQKTKVFLKNREAVSFAVARTGSTQETLQGYHDPNLLYIVEEASGVEDPVFEPIEGALTQEGAVLVLAGNPTRSKGYFYRSFTDDERFCRVRISCVDKTGVPHPLISADFIERIARRYGTDSDIYRVRVLGLPPRSGEDYVIPWEWVQQAVEMELPDTTAYRTLWGVDVARFGSDYTCVAKRRGNKVLEPVLAWNGYDTQQTVGRILREYRDTPRTQRPHEIFVDDIGVGGGVYDGLSHAGLPTSPVNVGRRAVNHDKFQYLRDELWWAGREFFEGLNVDLPDDEELIRELTTPKYEYKPNGKLQVETKAQFKTRLNDKSPDRADALLLTFAGGMELIEENFKDAWSENDDYDKENAGVTWVGAW